MLKQAVTAVAAFTLLLGVAYPLALVGAAHVLPHRTVTLAQDTKGDPRYFQPRPSQTGYSATPTAYSDRGPNQRRAAAFYRREIAAYRRMNDGAMPPMDAVTTSASGLDPDISRANAEIQARRIARVRGLPLARITRLIAGARLNTTLANAELDR